MNNKAQTFLLSLVVFIVFVLIGLGAYFFFFYAPSAVTVWIGEPSPDLDRSQVLVLSAKLFYNHENLLTVTQVRQRQQVFTIEMGQTGYEIAASLAERNYIPNADVFINYLVYKGIDRLLQSGVYLIPREITPKALADSFYDQNPEDVSFAFLPGWRVEEIAALLPSSGINIDPDELIQYVKNTPLEIEGVEETAGLEGFLFPGVYQILRDSSVEDFVRQHTQAFMQMLPEDYELRLNERGLSLHEGVIIASIIEKETVIPEEAPIVAAVFLKRLAADMPLQSDPTVQYALGYDTESRTWWKNPLTASDLRVESPYNTYKVENLPPAPICNPGINALLAVVDAPETEFFFFRAACDGSGLHIFSRTYEEHLEAACD